jgi:hypothetical protein
LIECLYSDLELEGSGKWMPVVQIGSLAKARTKWWWENDR